MKNILLLILSTSSFFCNAQKLSNHNDTVKFKVLDSTYVLSDSLNMLFSEKNHDLIEYIYWRINELPFDKCKNSQINYALYIDTLRKVTIVDLFNSVNAKVDSLIKNELIKTSGKWNLVKFKGNITKILFLSGYTKPGYGKMWSKYPGVGKDETQIIPMEDKDCANNNFYYDNGVDAFKKNDFKEAIYNFKKAVTYNPYDIDAYYNLAICYVKTNQTEKACECFSKLFTLGDNSPEKLFRQICVPK